MRGLHHALIAGLAASAAVAQVNRGFETGDLSAYLIHDAGSGQSTVVTMTDSGKLPTQGAFCARIQNGQLTAAQAEAVMDLPTGRLGTLYLDLGGNLGSEQGGDYNVLGVNLPRGDYVFDWIYETTDLGSNLYLDHAFVVNGSGIITVLADGLTGPPGLFLEQAISHPGGWFYFVAANGGDTSADGALFIDDTRLVDVTNGSFELATFEDWTFEDNGAGHALIVGGTGNGLPPTDGGLMARLTAGELSQASAESVMGLPTGTLADLYLDLGGTGDPQAGDYIVLWQDLPGNTVMLDWAYEGGDAYNSDFLDHAFVVDSLGRITVLANSYDDGTDISWYRYRIPHTGGRFFIVCANGGDTSVAPELYVDRVVTGPLEITSETAWNGSTGIASFGAPNTATYGQTFTARPEMPQLESMTFFIRDDEALPIEFEGYVYAWDGEKAMGPALFASDVLSTDGVAQGYETVFVRTPGTKLEPGQEYVAFLTVSNTMPTNGGAWCGHPNGNQIGKGEFVFQNNGNDFGALFTTPWTQDFIGIDYDLACAFEFGPADSVAVPNVNLYVAGPSNQGYPWATGGDFRYQQLYRADMFMGRAGYVDRISYRQDVGGAAFGPTSIRARIWLGYSSKQPGAMSATFNQNFSADKTLVFDGLATLRGNSNRGFDVSIDLDQAFFYDPADGNLLVEIILPDAGQPLIPQLDSAGYAVSSGGTPWTDRLWAHDASSPTGVSTGDDGLVTYFTLVPAASCPGDCDGNGVLNILDFVCFQTAWQSQTPFGDCDGNGLYNILDFVCYQGLFQQGCP